MRTRPISAMVVAALAASAVGAPVLARSVTWDVEASAGVSLFSPNVENIPRGSSDTAADELFEFAIGAGISDRVRLHATVGTVSASTSRWTSESAGGEADIPTPSITTLFLGVETPLRRGRIAPLAGIGTGVVVFGEIDEDIRFVWTSHTETNRFAVAGRTEPALFFDVGASARAGGRWHAVLRYRLLSVFSGDQVDTIDRVSLAVRVRL